MRTTAALTSPVHIVSACRTPIGSFLGSLATVSAIELGSAAIRGALERSRVPPECVEQVWMGTVLSAGLGQAPARQAAVGAKVPVTVPATTLNKVCGSGLWAVVSGARSIALGEADIIVAGGMESMSNAPYYLSRARTGYRLGDGSIVDGLLFDALRDAYRGYPMGQAAELCAAKYGVSRQAQDEYARESYRRARAAQASGLFDAEMVPIDVPGRGGRSTLVAEDDEPKRYAPEKMDSLVPAFSPSGTITAANASKINDGAAAVVLASSRAVQRFGLTPLARIAAYAEVAQDPEWFTTAPIAAVEKTLSRAGLRVKDVDLCEINEAFALVALVCSRACDLDPLIVNPRGGAVSLGHPVGASGARILATLVHALQQTEAHRGLATLCIGGGEAVAMLVER